MNNQILNNQKQSINQTARNLIMSILLIFCILILAVFNNDLNTIFGASILDCDNPASVLEALDQSRNGIINGCV